MFNPRNLTFFSRARSAVTYNYDPGQDPLDEVAADGYFPPSFTPEDDFGRKLATNITFKVGDTIVYDVIGTEGDCTLTVVQVEPKVEVLKLGEPTARPERKVARVRYREKPTAP